MSLVLSKRVAPKMLNKQEKHNLRSLMVSVLLFYHKTKINIGKKN